MGIEAGASMIESDSDLRHFFELSHDLLCVAGFDGYFKRINPAVVRTLGYTKAELLARPIDDFVHPDDRELTRLSRNQVTEGNPLINFENRYLTKNGEVVWLAWTSMPLEQEQLIYAIAKNVSSKKLLEADRNSLLSRLTQLNAELRQMTYTASHDLRSPVHNLLSLFELLDINKITDTETRQYVELLNKATQVLKVNLNQHVENLSQKESLIQSRELVSLPAILANIRLALFSLLEQTGTSITADFEAFDSLNFNASALESIFLNLISNSIKYAQPGQPPQIRISARMSGAIPQLIFSDNGLGFDMDLIQDKLYGLNQTFHFHPDSQGIGLYLVYNHLTSQGGHISLVSKPNEGASFTLSFKP